MNVSNTNVTNTTDVERPMEPRVFLAESVSEPAKEKAVVSTTGWRIWLWRSLCTGCHWSFGLASLIVILSVLATIPMLQFLSLGYLLEASGRIAKSRRLRDGFIGIPSAASVGSIACGFFLTMLPIRILSSFWYSSYLLNGDVRQTQALRIIVLVLGMFAMLHIAWAAFRGGKLRHFFWPAPLRLWRRVREGGMYDEASYRLLSFAQSLRLGHYFWLGLRGFIGAVVWLVLPTTLMALATQVEQPEVGGLIAFIGGILLATVLVYLPFLQVRLPITGRFRSQFEIRAVRQSFRRAPIAYWFSLLMTLALAIPLYLLKAELIPREAAWLPSLAFVALMLPARFAVGWAVGRSENREERRHWFFRWAAWFGLLPVSAIFAFVVYFTQFTSWHGALSLYEQHAFLVPVPFLGY